MGYFPNGTAAADYEERWCARCVHNVDTGCAVMAAHFLHNYKECNNPGSILHMLIPFGEDEMSNDECRLFHEQREPSA